MISAPQGDNKAKPLIVSTRRLFGDFGLISGVLFSVIAVALAIHTASNRDYSIVSLLPIPGIDYQTCQTTASAILGSIYATYYSVAIVLLVLAAIAAIYILLFDRAAILMLAAFVIFLSPFGMLVEGNQTFMAFRTGTDLCLDGTGGYGSIIQFPLFFISYLVVVGILRFMVRRRRAAKQTQ
jgi:hypothetical protein